MTYCYFAFASGRVRKSVKYNPDLTEIVDYYISSYDSDEEDVYYNKEMILYPDVDDPEIFWADGTIGNMSAEQDEVVFEGTIGECIRYIRHQMENEA